MIPQYLHRRPLQTRQQKQKKSGVLEFAAIR
jgi:hypothetical protein